MNNSGKLFTDEFTEWLLYAGFIKSQFQMSIYYKYILSYVDDFVDWYTSEDIGKWFVDALGKIFDVNFLGYARWFTPIIISNMKDHSVCLDQAIYDTSIVAK